MSAGRASRYAAAVRIGIVRKNAMRIGAILVLLALSGCASLLRPGTPDGTGDAERPPAPEMPSGLDPTSVDPTGIDSTTDGSLLTAHGVVRERVRAALPPGAIAVAGDVLAGEPAFWIRHNGAVAGVTAVNVKNDTDFFRYVADQEIAGPRKEMRWRGPSGTTWEILARWSPDTTETDNVAEYHAVSTETDNAALYLFVTGDEPAAQELVAALLPRLALAPDGHSGRWRGFTGFFSANREMLWLQDLDIADSAAVEVWIPPRPDASTPDPAAYSWTLWIVDGALETVRTHPDTPPRLSDIAIDAAFAPSIELGAPIDARPARTWSANSYTGRSVVAQWTRASGTPVTIALIPGESSVGTPGAALSPGDVVAWFNAEIAPLILLGEEEL